jgi:hypothetical protein
VCCAAISSGGRVVSGVTYRVLSRPRRVAGILVLDELRSLQNSGKHLVIATKCEQSSSSTVGLVAAAILAERFM